MSTGSPLALLHIYKSLEGNEYIQGIPGMALILHQEGAVMTKAKTKAISNTDQLSKV